MAELLLDRNTFRESVFKRDHFRCVVCGQKAEDAHHIMERRLFSDGGYYLDNGASLCSDCHIKAEQTLITTDFLRFCIKADKRILPEHLYEDYDYDKWGNIINANQTRVKGELFFDESVQKILKSAGVLSSFGKYIKYPRTYHLPFSPGRTEDDKTLKDCSIFENKDVIITTKMDGENTTGYWDGCIHARSLDSDNHKSRNWVKKYLSDRLYELPEGWRICGENLFAKHSIHYKDLPSYFNLFSIWNEKNECLSWDDTWEWAKLLDLHLVPYLHRGIWSEQLTKDLSGMLKENVEGFVVRSSESFTYAAFRLNVAKWVRANHVQTNQHWIKTKLIQNEIKQ